jgi:superfamily II DNA or RNA helicase
VIDLRHGHYRDVLADATQGLHMRYEDYIANKMRVADPVGFNPQDLSPHLFPYQADIVRWALNRGRAAIFADCGMGKTLMQLEFAHRVTMHTGGRAIVLCPLAVAEQTVREARKFGIDASYMRDDDGATRIAVVNYEMMARFDMARFSAVVLDESSILKSFDGKTRTEIIESTAVVPYRLACTATPAPNDHMELGNHAQFCGIMSREEMLASFFVHDTGGNTSDWRLKGHARDAFWRWVASWAVSIRTPSDIGHSDDGFDLPALHIHTHVVEAPQDTTETGMLFRMEALTLSELRAESKRTMSARVDRIAELINGSSDPWIVWCHTNAEEDALTAAIDGAVAIRGSDSPESKRDRMIAFADGAIRVLVTKPSIAGFGMNWQHCAHVAFVGLSHSYEQFYQAVRRCWRFGQRRDVNVHVAIADTEQSVLRSIREKQAAADTMAVEMTRAMRDTSIANVRGGATVMRDDYERDVFQNDQCTLHLGDCVEVWREMPDESVGMMVFSPPFASLFTYSNSARDMGNATDDEDFARHFAFLIGELFRTLQSGRICAVHCMNLPTSKSRHGHIGIRDFRGEIIRAFEDAGFIYHSEVTIWKDPVTSMQRTKAHGLLYKTLCSDSAKSRQGFPDYLVVFQKPGDNASPVSSGGERFDSYIGTDGPAGSTEDDERRYSIDVWQRYASPVWFDIDQSRTLNYREAREDDDERHICPLQLDVIERAIHLWSNPGDVVGSPFAGIGSELVSAIRMGRRAVGAELKKSYWQLAARNVEDECAPSPQLSLLGAE